jgi:hypothetical protein
MLIRISFFSIFIFTMTSLCWAMDPTEGFIKKGSLGSVINYRNEKADIDLSSMETDITYSDLSKEGVEELNSLFEVKKEYGNVFGFSEWTPKDQKLVEEKTQRLFLLQGQYKDRDKKTVYFIEVYWATQKTSGQYLLTSNTEAFKIDDYKKYLK